MGRGQGKGKKSPWSEWATGDRSPCRTHLGAQWHKGARVCRVTVARGRGKVSSWRRTRPYRAWQGQTGNLYPQCKGKTRGGVKAKSDGAAVLGCKGYSSHVVGWEGVTSLQRRPSVGLHRGGRSTERGGGSSTVQAAPQIGPACPGGGSNWGRGSWNWGPGKRASCWNSKSDSGAAGVLRVPRWARTHRRAGAVSRPLVGASARLPKCWFKQLPAHVVASAPGRHAAGLVSGQRHPTAGVLGLRTLFLFPLFNGAF